MQTADICVFVSPNIEKQANLQHPLNLQKLEVFQLKPSWPPDQGLCHLHIAPWIRFYYIMMYERTISDICAIRLLFR